VLDSYARALFVVEVVDLKLLESPDCKGWRLADTNVPEDEPPPPFAFGDSYQVIGRSLLLFLLEPDGA
jgi:isoamylase